MKRILIVDFDDSFIYNVAELCQRWELDFEVHHFSKVTREFIENNNFKNIIWGPGPGHPDQYSEISSLLKELLSEEFFHLGICLGHQLIFKALGFEIENAEVKRHGRSGGFIIPKWPVYEQEDWGKEVEVQYYNSLAVKAPKSETDLDLAIKDGAIMSGFGKSFLSYQFHPESVGTSCPDLLFRGFREKLI
ncbi:MAG: anthranilate/para-aminobenzoate synthase component II [Bacteriovoracaceae bacterium]|jgi:anthranilate/para-aminobenzoate synthase component II